MTRFGIVLATMIAVQLQGREIVFWPYERLEKEADLIVIGPAEKSEDSGEFVPGSLWNVDFVGVNTTIKVTGVLKGRLKEKQLTIFHLRIPDGMTLKEGPSTLTFRTGVLPIKSPGTVTSLARPEYLMFLKKRDDGRFEPISGPLESAHSFREVYLPMNR
jgi:hypothetical protein